MSKRSSLLSSPVFSNEGWKQLQEPKQEGNMGNPNPNDATINIPLTTVRSNPGLRQPVGLQSPQDANEKTSFFKRPGGPGGIRHRGPKNRNAQDAANGGEEDALTYMGRVYNRILNFSIITRYFVFILPVALVLAVPIIIGATAAKKASLGGVRIVWLFTWVEIVWLSLWVSKLFARSTPSIFQFLCGIVSSGTRKYALVLKALEIPISLAGWALASLATFIPLMTRNPDQRHSGDTGITHWESIVNKILAAALISSLLLLGEKLIIQLISISYHRKQFDLKIKDSKHNVHLLSLLYEASRELFPAYCPEFAEEDYIINDTIDISVNSNGGSRHARSGSATPMRLLQNVNRVGDKITAAFGNIAHEVTGKTVFNPTSAHSIVVEALEKNASSEALARRIWMSFVVEGKDALFQEDIIEVLTPQRQTEAEECFAALDRDGNGDISLDEMILTVCDFGRERKSIANSLHDVDQAINVLDNLLCVVLFVIVLFIFIAFLNANFTTTLATTGTALLSLSFVFATTCQEFLGSCIFLFVKHPFDVGDRVDIGADPLVVEHISLLFTVFKRLNTHKTTQVPNIVLNGIWIDNVSRSKAMREQLVIDVSFDTSIEDIQLLKNEMSKFVMDRENCRDFQSEVEVSVTNVGAMNQLELTIELKHKSNWSNEAVRASRRSKFMCALVLALRRIPIYAPGGGGAALGSPDAPSYSVAVSDNVAAASRDAFSKAKEQKRMVQTESTATTVRDRSTSSSSFSATFGASSPTSSGMKNRSPTIVENQAANSLNARHPALDPAHDWQTETSPNNSETTAGTNAETARRNDLEEVRGMLRRQSTRGKRRNGDVPGSRYPANSGGAANGLAPVSNSNIPLIREPSGTSPTLSAQPSGTTYHEYASSPPPASSSALSSNPITRGRVEADSGYNPYAQSRLQREQQQQQQMQGLQSSPPRPPQMTQMSRPGGPAPTGGLPRIQTPQGNSRPATGKEDDDYA
ncbi:hypothetical protein MMC25_004419 [Agyrium rufum]|nr:hypothetical protein [Agyrium rufum]